MCDLGNDSLLINLQWGWDDRVTKNKKQINLREIQAQ